MFEALDENKPLRDILSSYNIFEFFTRASLSVHFKTLWEKHLFLNCCGYPMSQSNLNMLHLRKKKLKFTGYYGSDSEADFAPC